MIGKVRVWAGISLVFIINYFGIIQYSNAQSFKQNKYGLYVITDITDLCKTVVADSNKQMLDLKKYLPGLTYDLRYATTNNFMNKKLYPSIHTTYLRRAAIEALKKVLQELNKENLTLKIFDAYRPYSVTEKMWEIIKDDRYVADPSKGSGHNRGIAVDLTLVGIKSKNELPMGTGFDNFSDTAHINFTALPAAILRNRDILKSAMEKNGFVSFDTEWWHFSLPNASSFELLNISFKELKKVRQRCR